MPAAPDASERHPDLEWPNDEAVFKLFFLAIRNARLRWKADPLCYRALAQLDIFFEGRLPA